jgi:hypothetical protein
LTEEEKKELEILKKEATLAGFSPSRVHERDGVALFAVEARSAGVGFLFWDGTVWCVQNGYPSSANFTRKRVTFQKGLGWLRKWMSQQS